MPDPETIHGLNESTYHADPDTLSASAAKTLLGKRPPSGDSDSMRLGTLVHTVILEPERLDEYAVLDPDVIGVKADGSKAGTPTATKAWKDAVFAAKRDGLIVISPAEMDKANRMAQAVMEHPEAGRLLALATDHEVSAYADHPTGARVRGRFDLIGPGFIGDIKTTRNADPDAFGKTTHDLGYHISGANYLDIATACGFDVNRFVLICVENEPNLSGQFRVSVNEIAERAIERGRELMHEACERWLALGKRVELPDYGDDCHVIDLPPWAYPRRDYETPATIPADYEWKLDEYA